MLIIIYILVGFFFLDFSIYTVSAIIIMEKFSVSYL